jgi:hypothetical protein
MKQKKILLFCLCFFSLVSVPGITEGFELVDKKNLKLTLNLRLALCGEYDVGRNEAGGSIDSTRIAFPGTLYQLLGFKISFDTDVLDNANNDYYIVLRDMYIQFLFHDYVHLRVGQFKVPFGEEIFNSLGERPYIERTHTTDNIAPGRDLGIMAAGKEIVGLFGYNLGVFLGIDPDLPRDAEGTYLAAGKLFARYQPGIFDLKIGYNAYYQYYHVDVSNHHLAQGFFGKAGISFGKDNDLSFLIEYQERLRVRSVINQNLDWRRGVFGVVSYRYGPVEPLVLVEWYNDSLLYTDENGLFSLKTGIAGYFLKKDILRMKLLYELDYPPDPGEISHKVSAMVQIEF